MTATNLHGTSYLPYTDNKLQYRIGQDLHSLERVPAGHTQIRADPIQISSALS